MKEEDPGRVIAVSSVAYKMAKADFKYWLKCDSYEKAAAVLDNGVSFPGEFRTQTWSNVSNSIYMYSF